MTTGPIPQHLLSFAIPLLIGYLFQQLYNTVDTWVVGNYVSNEAFSAVGTTGPIINVLIGFFLGLASGAGVVISQYYGARDEESVQKAVHTAAMLTIIMGIAFTIIGTLGVPLMLKLIKMPESVVPEATIYLSIYFEGVIGLMIYNMGAGIMRAIGDSVRPFLFLVASALTNTVLDLVFVLGFNMKVAGVALATVIAQAVSAILVLIVLFRSKTCVKLQVRKIKLHRDALRKIIKVGFPAAIQTAITAFSNVFVQSYINFFETDVMSGWTAYNKIDTLLLLPAQSMNLASTTFVGQNLGVGQVDRAKKGVNISIIITISTMIVLMIPCLIFAPQIVSFFNQKPEVIESGSLFLRLMSPFYVFCCFNQIHAGALRGAGDSKAPMFIMLGSFVVFRQIYLFVTSHFIANEVIPIVMGYPAGWMMCSLIMFIYYKKVGLKGRVLT
ncbi:MAG: MATE family efflux transporter [Clostridia bacterium]|nr:MATE family efflux transporter [Clostridia bacterium]